MKTVTKCLKSQKLVHIELELLLRTFTFSDSREKFQRIENISKSERIYLDTRPRLA